MCVCVCRNIPTVSSNKFLHKSFMYVCMCVCVCQKLLWRWSAYSCVYMYVCYCVYRQLTLAKLDLCKATNRYSWPQQGKNTNNNNNANTWNPFAVRRAKFLQQYNNNSSHNSEIEKLENFDFTFSLFIAFCTFCHFPSSAQLTLKSPCTWKYAMFCICVCDGLKFAVFRCISHFQQHFHDTFLQLCWYFANISSFFLRFFYRFLVCVCVFTCFFRLSVKCVCICRVYVCAWSCMCVCVWKNILYKSQYALVRGKETQVRA